MPRGKPLSPEVVAEIANYMSKGHFQWEGAEKFGVSTGTIYRICKANNIDTCHKGSKIAKSVVLAPADMESARVEKPETEAVVSHIGRVSIKAEATGKSGYIYEFDNSKKTVNVLTEHASFAMSVDELRVMIAEVKDFLETLGV